MKYAAVLLALAACGGSRAAPPSKPAPTKPAPLATAELRFDWSPPCRVPVTEAVIKDGNTATLAYDVVVVPGGDAVWTVDRERVRFVEANGQRVTPALASQLRESEEMLELLPPVYIDARGQIVGTGDITPYIERMIAMIAKGDPAKEANLRKWFASSTILQSIADVQSNLWILWVADWIEWDGTPGQRIEGPASDVIGAEVDGTYVIEELPRRERRTRLHFEMTITGDGARAVMAELMNEMAASMGVDPSALEVREASMQSSKDVELEPATMRTRTARSIADITLAIGDMRKTRIERHDYTFDWAHAEGCGS